MTTESYGNVSNIPKEAPTFEKIVSQRESILENLKSEDKDKLMNGLKTLLAYMTKGDSVPESAPFVIIALSHKEPEIRHLAAIVAVMIQDVDSEVLLLSVGSFLKSVFQEPSTRVLSLKAFTSLYIPDLREITMEHLVTCYSDPSPYVRREVAIALTKKYNGENKEQFLQIIEKLLNDQSPIVISAALYALSVIEPENDSIFHKYYRRMVSMIEKLDPWGQTILLRILLHYVRRNFAKPENHEKSDDWDGVSDIIDPDLELLFTNLQPLLYSITPSVSLHSALIYYYCAPSLKRSMFIKPIIRLIYGDVAVQSIALSVISSIASEEPELFVPHIKHFFINEIDSTDVKLLKMKVISQLSRSMNFSQIVEELVYQTLSPDKNIARAAVMSIGRAISLAQPISYNTLIPLIKLLNTEGVVQWAAIHCLCVLLNPLPHKDEKPKEVDPLFGDISEESLGEEEVISLIKRLLTFFGKIGDDETKASLISLIGNKAKLIPLHAHEVLRQLAITFLQQKKAVKLQTIFLAGRVFCLRPKESGDLVRFVLSQAMYDADVDVRDRVRLTHALLSAPTENSVILGMRKNASGFLFVERPDIKWDNSAMGASRIEAGTFGQYFELKEAPLVVPWGDNIPPSSVRDGDFDKENLINNETSEKIDDDESIEQFLGLDAPSSSSKSKDDQFRTMIDDSNDITEDF